MAAAAAAQTSPDFESSVRPFVSQYCAACHNSTAKVGGLDLTTLDPTDYGGWEKARTQLKAGSMPPPGLPAPDAAAAAPVIAAITAQLAKIEASHQVDPGRVTARRLNRIEYDNTVRDLLGLNIHASDEFPADDSGYGFDNNGDVLTISPLLMEKYLAAARKIASEAIVTPSELEPSMQQFMVAEGAFVVDVRGAYNAPADADYEFSIFTVVTRPDNWPGPHAVMPIQLQLNGEPIYDAVVDTAPNLQRVFEFNKRLPAGKHEIRLILPEDVGKPVDQTITRSRTNLDHFEVRGPFNVDAANLPSTHKRIFVCSEQTAACGEEIVKTLARRAFRRPVTDSEIAPYAALIAAAQADGDSFEEGVQLALQALLVSPNFLYRIEGVTAPTKPGEAAPLNDHELASRLSYFLWASMPDEKLFALADEGKLRSPEVLASQVKRMLADEKSMAFIDSFSGQWLQTRNLDGVIPDPVRFPDFDEELRAAMDEETRLFFAAIVQENRSILDFIDGKFTFLNGRLAEHYGIKGINGHQMRRVELNGEQRSGILTQASVLTVTSYENRTSPVLRGKWLLSNILGTPPPPPPPNIPTLEEAKVAENATLRERLEAHRASSTCAACHIRMDPLGFGLENYDAIGAWRTTDGKFEVDASGTLPDGQSFRKPSELKQILRGQRREFAASLTEKMMTYALGRGVGGEDRVVVNRVVNKLAGDDYRFERMIIEIVESAPFQMRRSEGEATR